MDDFDNIVKKFAYDSDMDDILKDFYIPALAISKKYFRLTGFFSSNSIGIASKGIRNLIKNGGTMKLITGIQLSLEDKESIEKNVGTNEKLISKNILKELESFSEKDFSLQHAKLLGWMLRNNLLEMKIAVVSGPGIFHQKVGILQDITGKEISFSGSNNETAGGWVNDIEEFKVFKSWVEGQSEYFQHDELKFNQYWYNKAERCSVYELPDAIREHLIEISPKNYEDLDLGYDDGIEGIQNNAKELWDHQKDAIAAWVNPPEKTGNHPFQGIFSMATGSGKTLAAIHASLLADKNTITIIAMPSQIMSQWEQEIREIVPDAKIIFAGGSDSNWKTKIPTHLAPYKISSPDQQYRTFILCTYDTLGKSSFQNLFKPIDSKFLQIIADEVHHSGTKSRVSIFEMKADRVLGLSATHTRHWDDEGTESMLSFFGQPVYEFTLKDGIDLEKLCHYEYIPHFVSMTQTEQDGYKEASQKIGMLNHKLESNRNINLRAQIQSQLTIAQNARKKIIRKAENKPHMCRDILKQSFEDNEKAIIFCDDSEQEESIITILRDQNKEMREYSEKRTNAEKFSAIRDFKSGVINFLLGIKMLDEGIDIPDIEKCLIVASTTNPREFIQRRGRILRISDKNPDKVARMHDLIVLPTIDIPQGRDLTDSEEKSINSLVKIIQGEFDRVKQLITSADNLDDVLICLRKESQRLGIENRINFTV